MQQQIENLILWIKQQPIKGCITGSALLDYFPDSHQDVDVFVYDEKSFNKLLFAMHHNDMFQILDPMENWKFERFINVEEKTFTKQGLVTIKFTYNTCVDANIILKRNCNNIFSVLSSFDLDIITKGFDIATQQYLDLTGNSTATKVANYNKWNPAFLSEEIWQISRVLRQLERCFKYHKRGYNTDAVVYKYLELIENIEKYETIFNSENFNEKLKLTKANVIITKEICKVWLETHTISEKEVELLKETLRKL